MDPAPAEPRALDAPDFVDGLGERALQIDPASGDSVEVLRLRGALTSVPSFEFAVRERTARLANFRHPAFARVRRVDRGGATGLVLVSDHVAGFRLSQMLRIAGERRIPIDTSAALSLIRQLLPEIALLHENARDVSHGALAPERLIVTPHARLVVAEYVLGSALEQLHLSHERLWTDYRIAMPPSAGAPRFDHRADVMQIGITSLSLILGRTLRDGELSRIAEVLAESTETSAGGARQPLSQGLRGWLARALQLDSRRPLPTVRDAMTALDQVLAVEAQYVPSTVAVEAFISQCVDSIISASVGAGDVLLTIPQPLAPPPIAPAAPGPLGSPTPAIVTPTLSVAPGGMSSPAADLTPDTSAATVDPAPEDWPPLGLDLERLQQSIAAQVPFDDTAEAARQSEVRQPVRRPKQWMKVAAIVVLLLATAAAGVAVARRYLTSAAPAVLTGTLVVESAPAGVEVVIDGEPRGVTPLRVSLNPGPHILELRGRGTPRVFPVTLGAGTTLSQFVELAEASSPVTGQLDIRSDPAGARITIDGQPVGVSPMVVSNLAAGSHTVLLEREGTSVEHTVTIEPGATASLVAPVAPPSPASGWIAVSAPYAMQIFEDGRLIGSTESEQIMVAAGRHTFEIVNASLGFRSTRVVQVQAGRTATIGIELPNGTVNINAQPWAEVWVGKRRIGETPIGNLSLPIGPHEVVFRHPQFGERRQVIQVTTGDPVRVSVDMQR